MDIAEKILLARRKLGFSQSELSQKSGISRVSINRYENGKGVPKREQLIKLCNILGIPFQEMAVLIKEEEEKRGRELGQKKAKDFLEQIKD
jgi:transcriptional regulator with XRE-family HTH domain